MWALKELSSVKVKELLTNWLVKEQSGKIMLQIYFHMFFNFLTCK